MQLGKWTETKAVGDKFNLQDKKWMLTQLHWCKHRQCNGVIPAQMERELVPLFAFYFLFSPPLLYIR